MMSKPLISTRSVHRLLRSALPLPAAMLLGVTLLAGCKSDDHIPITGALLEGDVPAAAAPAGSCCAGADGVARQQG